MTALLDSAALDQAGDTGTTLIRLIRAEFMKIRTTSTGWLFLTGFIVFTAMALTINGFGIHSQLYPQQGLVSPAQAVAQAAQARSPAGMAAIAASMMTSGQRIGVMFALLLGVLVVTSEFANQTAAVTFVTVPRRTTVIIAKVAAAACCGALFWLAGTVLAAVATPLFLYSQHLSTSLAGWTVARSVLLNLLAFVAWGVFGLGLGAMLRSQIVAVLAAIAVYAGSFGTELVFTALYNFFHQGWMLGAPVIGPAVASEVMTTSGPAFPDAPPGWLGGIIMIGYTAALVAGGIALTRRRDVI
ncbi:MAG: ABC transporter permease subunit [Streptosporangiaceae bacterium]|jgi:ABC-type transport system involved in multi-copper enzyme maturation permease subunit